MDWNFRCTLNFSCTSPCPSWLYPHLQPSWRADGLGWGILGILDVLCLGYVRPSVRPSICPRFLNFFSTCFEISIWNLVYAFSRWHDMSSVSFITIGSLWPSLQPKVGQTQFLQSWPYKSRSILQILYVDGLLYASQHKFRFLQKSYFLNFGDYFCAFWILRSFPGFFLHVLRYQFETWYIHLVVGSVTREVWVSFQLGHFDLLYSQK